MDILSSPQLIAVELRVLLQRIPNKFLALCGDDSELDCEINEYTAIRQVYEVTPNLGVIEGNKADGIK